MKNKKLLAGTVALALAATFTIGGTLAYLSSITETKTNTFTMGSGIEGEIEEPNWKKEEAADFYPGKVIAKDPIIKNNSAKGTDDAYVAATISYQVLDADGKTWKDTSYAELDKFINIQSYADAEGSKILTAGFNTDKWTMNADNTVAYYESKLPAMVSTEAIFDAVEIDELGLTPEQVNSFDTENVQFDETKYEVKDADGTVSYTYATYTMSDFQIVVKGYLVQSSGFDNVQAAMQEAFPEIF